MKKCLRCGGYVIIEGHKEDIWERCFNCGRRVYLTPVPVFEDLLGVNTDPPKPKGAGEKTIYREFICVECGEEVKGYFTYNQKRCGKRACFRARKNREAKKIRSKKTLYVEFNYAGLVGKLPLYPG